MKKLLLPLNILALILTLLMNGLSQTSIFPNTIAELGESRAVFFLPAGYVFAIWGLIYLGLIGFAFYQAFNEKARETVGWYFILNCVANIAWLFLFLYNFIWLSTVAMLVLLFSLIMIYRRLRIGFGSSNAQEKILLHSPFSIYLGWISVATVANFSAALHDLGFVTSFIGISADIWAVVMMLVAAVLAVTMLFLRHDYAYAAVIVWALIGIYMRPFTTPAFAPIAELNIDLVHNAALGIALIIALGALIQLGRSLMTGNEKREFVRAQ